YTFAAAQVDNCNPSASISANCQTNLPRVQATPATLQTGLQIAFGSIAAVAVLIIVIAGLQLIVAQGEPQSISKARQTIIYAVVGLAIALFAEAAVTLLIGKL
ncbi:MAG: hypothetical protein JWS12_434, partial [Candidatus Saccharibacteria bacterium]|nr:hypothetical protein [Candidatus Saccharibacteria bacterium]